MATFKVGQRVRIVRSKFGLSVGCEATIEAIPPRCPCEIPGSDCEVKIDGWPGDGPHGTYATPFSWIAPLTDPKAEEFLERIRKMEREPLGTVLGNKRVSV